MINVRTAPRAVALATVASLAFTNIVGAQPVPETPSPTANTAAVTAVLPFRYNPLPVAGNFVDLNVSVPVRSMEHCRQIGQALRTAMEGTHFSLLPGRCIPNNGGEIFALRPDRANGTARDEPPLNLQPMPNISVVPVNSSPLLPMPPVVGVYFWHHQTRVNTNGMAWTVPASIMEQCRVTAAQFRQAASPGIKGGFCIDMASQTVTVRKLEINANAPIIFRNP